MNYFKILTVSFVILISTFGQLFSESGTTLNIGADLMSRYIFRGFDYGNSPSIQPTVSIKSGGLEVGYWGAIATNSFYQEIDLYAKYSIGNFAIIFTDYYIPSMTGTPASPDTRFFTFDDKTTSHTFEAALQYTISEDIPLKLYAATFFYGNDKRWGFDAEKDSKEDTYFSTYIEASYSMKIGENNFDIFLGMTPSAGAFGNDLGVVNLGYTAYKTIKFSSEFEMPVKGSVIYNPQASAIHYIFGFSL